MAKRTQLIADKVAAMTSTEWSKESLMSMSERELRQIYTQQRDIMRKRISKLESSGFGDAPILQRFDLAPKLSEIKNKDMLVNELKDMHRFLGFKSSTVSGQREQTKHFRESMNEIADRKLTGPEAEQMGKLMDKISVAVKDKAFKYKVAQAMMDFTKSKGIKNPQQFFKDIKYWARNIDKLNELTQIKTPTGRASQSSAAYRRAIRFYSKLEDFAGE